MNNRIKPDRRPTSQNVKISKERIDAILKDIADDSTRYHASEANGIEYTTFYWWIKQGQCDLKHNKQDTLHAYLVKALRKIEQEDIKIEIKKIKNNKTGHKGAEWILERRYWKQFSNNVQAIQLWEEMNLDQGGQVNEKVYSEDQQEPNGASQ